MKILRIIILSALLLSLRENSFPAYYLDYPLHARDLRDILGCPIEEEFILPVGDILMYKPSSGCTYRIILDFDTFVADYSAK